MSGRPLLGLAVAPDPELLGTGREVIEEFAELLEITPETLWAAGCGPGKHYDTFLDVARRSGRPIVGHGVGFSLGTRGLDARAGRWLDALRRDHAALGFRWYSEHLGFTEHEGRQAALPLPLPFTEEAVTVVAARLRALAGVVPDVAFENNVGYFAVDDPLAEPAFLAAICRAAECGLLLDLHNVHVQCANLGVDADAWLDALDASHVVEIHVSGGSVSDPGWLPSHRTFRLDTHDEAAPEEVWRSLERMLPRCPRLRAVTYERVAGTLDAASLPTYAADVRRLRAVLDAFAGPATHGAIATATLPRGGDLDTYERSLLDALFSAASGTGVAGRDLDPDGVRLTSLLLTKLRFERVTGGDHALLRRFERDPEAFTREFRRYVAEVEPTFVFPEDEARAFHAWESARGHRHGL